MDFTLDLIINDTDLRVLKAAGLNITVAKPVGTAKPNVAWLVIDPFPANKIQWSEAYGLYAATIQNLSQGTVISKFSELAPPQLDGKSYLFGVDDVAVFKQDIEPASKGSFLIENKMSVGSYPLLTFGLTQKAIIQNKVIAPSYLNAALVPAQMEVTFSPLTVVYVWLQNSYTSGTIITNITSKATRIEFGEGKTQQGLIFDASVGQFVPATDGVSGNEITLLTPARVY